MHVRVCACCAQNAISRENHASGSFYINIYETVLSLSMIRTTQTFFVAVVILYLFIEHIHTVWTNSWAYLARSVFLLFYFFRSPLTQRTHGESLNRPNRHEYARATYRERESTSTRDQRRACVRQKLATQHRSQSNEYGETWYVTHMYKKILNISMICLYLPPPSTPSSISSPISFIVIRLYNINSKFMLSRVLCLVRIFKSAHRLRTTS